MLNKDAFRIAVPSKGRLMEKSLSLLQQAGLRFRLRGRCLFAKCPDTGIMIILANAQDIPGMVEENAADLGITGSDLVQEKQVDVVEHLALGFGKCRLAFASHIDSP